MRTLVLWMVCGALCLGSVSAQPYRAESVDLEAARVEYEERMAQVARMEAHVAQQLEAVEQFLVTGELTDPHMVAFVGVPVFDSANLLQKIIDYLERLYEVYQRAQQLANEALALYNQARNLASLAEGISFRDDLHVAEYLFNQGLELAGLVGGEEFAGITYAAENIATEIFETWRGFEALRNSIDVRNLQHGDVVLEGPRDVKIFEKERVGRALKSTLQRLNRYHAEFVRSNVDLKHMKDSMRSSDGAREALEDLAAMTSASAEQMSLLMGVMALDVGANTAVEADRINDELEAMATRDRVVEEGRAILMEAHGTALPVHTGERSTAMTGLPSWY